MTSQAVKLAKPVPARFVMPAPQGKFGSYIGHDTITQILLGIVGPFEFKVEQVIYGPEGLVEAVTASLTLNVDGAWVTVTEVGDCEQPTNWKTQGARLKDAASDALKRCAMRFGLGLHLWAKGEYFLYDQLVKVSAAASESLSESPQTSTELRADSEGAAAEPLELSVK